MDETTPEKQREAFQDQHDLVLRDADGRLVLAEVKLTTAEDIRQAYGQAQAMIAKVIETAEGSTARITDEQRNFLALLAAAPSDADRIDALERANAAIAANFTLINDQLGELAKPQEIIRAAGEALERQVEVLRDNGTEQKRNNRNALWMSLFALLVSVAGVIVQVVTVLAQK